MDFQAGLGHLRSLELPAGQYAIFGSGPLVVRGWIPAANDIDVVCRSPAWERVCALGRSMYLAEWGVRIVEMLDGSLTFGTEWKAGNIEVDEVIDTAEEIDGLPFARLTYVAAFKAATRRPKDLEHLAAMAANGYPLPPAD